MKEVGLFNFPPIKSKTELKRLTKLDINQKIDWTPGQTMKLGKGRGFIIRTPVTASLTDIFMEDTLKVEVSEEISNEDGLV